MPRAKREQYSYQHTTLCTLFLVSIYSVIREGLTNQVPFYFVTITKVLFLLSRQIIFNNINKCFKIPYYLNFITNVSQQIYYFILSLACLVFTELHFNKKAAILKRWLSYH